MMNLVGLTEYVWTDVIGGLNAFFGGASCSMIDVFTKADCPDTDMDSFLA